MLQSPSRATNITIRVGLIDDTGARCGKTQEVTFGILDGYQEAKEKLEKTFNTNIQCLQIADEYVHTFGKLTLHQYLKAHKVYPSRHKIYAKVLKPTEETESDDNSNTDANTPTRKKLRSDSTTSVTSDASGNANIIPPADLVVLKSIGRGAVATVYKGMWKATPVAIKTTDARSRQSAAHLEAMITKEAAIHKHLIHPNIVQFLGVSRAEKSVSIVTELMSTSLDKVLWPGKSDCTLSKNRRIDFAKQLLQGLSFLHDNRTVHADIKPNNILLNKSMTKVKLCDMRLSRAKENMEQSTTQTDYGTYLYMAPEQVLHSVKSNFATDVWSMAFTIAELFTESEAWKVKGKAKTAVAKQMKAGNLPVAYNDLRKEEPDIAEILEPAFSYTPDTRPTAAVLLAAFNDL